MKKLIFYIFLCLPILGQSQTVDAHTWAGLGLSYKINDKFSVDYKTQTRFYRNASVLRVYFNQIGGSFKITDDFKVGLDYRFSRKKKNDAYFVSENRFMINAIYGYSVKPINMKLSVRARYQNGFDRLSTINNIIAPNIFNVFRLKFTAKYKNPEFKRVQPYIGYELFKSLDPEPIKFGVNTYRVKAGVLLDLPKKHEVKLYYIYQKNNGSIQEIRHIYAIQYMYSLNALFGK